MCIKNVKQGDLIEQELTYPWRWNLQYSDALAPWKNSIEGDVPTTTGSATIMVGFHGATVAIQTSHPPRDNPVTPKKSKFPEVWCESVSPWPQPA